MKRERKREEEEKERERESKRKRGDRKEERKPASRAASTFRRCCLSQYSSCPLEINTFSKKKSLILF